MNFKSIRELACYPYKIDEWKHSIGEWGKMRKAPFWEALRLIALNVRS